MPRTTPRPLASEDAVARRIAYERERRDYTYEGLAHRVTQAGCPINGSAIYKIEKAEPRRRITVDELVAFAAVFEISLDDLLLPPEVAATAEGRRLLARWFEARTEAARANQALNDAWRALIDLLGKQPGAAEGLVEDLRAWAREEFGEKHEERATAYWMATLEGVDAEERFAREMAAERGAGAS